MGSRTERLPAPRVGHPGRHHRADPAQVSGGQLLSGLAAGASAARRVGADQRRRQLPARGVHTRRLEKLAESLGVDRLSKSQVSVMAKNLDEMVAQFHNRPLDAGPYTFVWPDELTIKVREGGRITIAHALIAVRVNADGQRESSAWGDQ